MQIHLPAQRLDHVPVLLLGGVNLVRSLGLAGIPAIAASPQADDPVFASRYCAGRVVLPAYESGDAAADAIVTLGDRLCAMYGRRIPLMYGSDDALELLYAHRERLERYFLLLLNETRIGKALLDKDLFAELARERALPVPRTLAWEGAGDAIVAQAPGPVIMKPRVKLDWYASHVRERLFGDSKARVFESGSQAAGDAAVAMFHDRVTFQEYVAGDDTSLWSFHGVADEKGAILDCFVGRKIRTYPPLTGESAFIELDEDAELTRIGADVAAAIPLRGPFKMDFKKDAVSGRWYLLEINARFNLWHYLGAVNGINLVRTAYDYLLEGVRPVTPSVYATTYRWLSFELDLAAFRALRRSGELGAAEWLASLAFSRNACNYFSWRDPGPWLLVWARRARKVWRRGPRFVYSRMRQWLSTAS
jgi:predicted ATP-grasp superfamily ATP-dependent carboligase